jgi:nitroreductase
VSEDLAFGEDAPLFNVMSTMRAMRRLKPDPVPRELLEKLIQAAANGPSGGNNQTFSFVVVTDREQVANLAPVWRRIVDWYVTTQTPPPHMSPDAWDRLIDALRYQADNFEDIPALIVACYELRGVVSRMMRTLDKQRAGFSALGPRHTIASARNTRRFLSTGEAASIYPGLQNLLLAARALGLGATLTTWHIMFEQEVKHILGVPGHVNTYAIVPVGYPRGKFGPVSRRPIGDAIHWERW